MLNTIWHSYETHRTHSPSGGNLKAAGSISDRHLDRLADRDRKLSAFKNTKNKTLFYFNTVL